MRMPAFLLLVTCLLCACAGMPAFPAGSYRGKAWMNPAGMGLAGMGAGLIASGEEEPNDETGEPEERPFLVDLLLYLPNRLLDAGDLVRAGVSVGPGMGIDLTATEWANVSLMTKTSAGLGYETLRHLPVELAAYTAVGAGPVKVHPEAGLTWYRSPGDIRVEVHLLIVGAHAAVEPFEMGDFIVGFFGLDPMDDDF